MRKCDVKCFASGKCWAAGSCGICKNVHVLGATLLVAGGRVKIPKTFGWEDKRKFGLCRSRALGEEEDGNAEDFFLEWNAENFSLQD
jgi:hypothetical protein